MSQTGIFNFGLTSLRALSESRAQIFISLISTDMRAS